MASWLDKNSPMIKKIRKRAQSLLGLALIIVIFMLLTPSYRQLSNFTDILAQSAVLAIMALGTTIVLISGGLDLSVGSTLALSACVAGSVLTAGCPVWSAVVLAFITGLFIGFING